MRLDLPRPHRVLVNDMKSTQLLIDEHKLILRALDVLDAIGAAAEETRSVDEVDVERDRKSTRLNSSHSELSRMPSSA